MMKAIWTALLLTVGTVCWLAALVVGLWMTWVLIDQELTQGAFLKRFWFETLLSMVLIAAGYGAIMWGSERSGKR